MKFVSVNRGVDKWGSGDYGAPRGKRTHNGIDLVIGVTPDPIEGIVTRVGIAYRNWNYKYVQITDDHDYEHRIFYISPLVKVGDIVNKHTIIGIHQGLTQKYPGMTTHVHYEIKRNGEYFDPRKVFHALDFPHMH